MKAPKPLQVFEVPLKGINLVESSAGTGKTYNIAGIYVRAVAEYGLMPQQIVVVTFTKAATQELRERIGAKLKEAYDILATNGSSSDHFLNQFKAKYQHDTDALQYLEKAIKNFDLAQISTIHGFCQQALQEYIFESNNRFDIDYSGNTDDLITDMIDDLWRTYMKDDASDSMKKSIMQRFLLDVVKTPDALKNTLIEKTGKPYLKYALEYSEGRLNELSEQWEMLEKDVIDAIDFEALDKFLASPNLNKSTYNASRKLKIVGMLTEWKTKGEITLKPLSKDDCKNIELVSTDGVALKSGNSIPELPMLNAMDDLVRFYEESISFLCEHLLIKLSIEFEENLAKKKEDVGIGSFDDILIGMMQAVKRKPMRDKLREAYPLALVDEFQDTDPIQLEIFKEIYSGFPEGGLFMIGDPKQSIYRFRGADIESYLSIRKSDDVTIYQLGENFRSSHSLVEAINELFDAGEDESMPGNIPFYRSLAHKKDDEFILPDSFLPSPIQFLKTTPELDLVSNKEVGQAYAIQNLTSEIARLLKSGAEHEAKIVSGGIERGIQPRDICVLVQSHADAEKVKRALLNVGVKSVTNSKQNVFSSKESEFITEFVTLLKQPGYLPYLRTFLFSNFMGWPLSRINEMEQDEQVLSEFIQTIEALKNRYEQFGFASAFQAFLNLKIAYIGHEKHTVEERILSLDQNERRYTNLIHLSELISQNERKQKMGPEGLIKWLLKRKENHDEEYQIRLESDDNLVQIVTIHSSKGLEFPIVFCPFLWHHLPYKNKTNPFVYHANETDFLVDFSGITQDQAKPLVFAEEIAEKIRLAYVALTRAKYRCYIQLMPYSNSKTDSTSGALSYILSNQEDKKAFKSGDRLDATLHLSRAQILSEQFPELFHVTEVQPLDGMLKFNQTKEQLDDAKQISRTDLQEPSWFVTSYSGLKKQRVESIKEHHDDRAPEDSPETKEESINYDIFHFPKGARSGVLMHALFEDIDFPDFHQKAPAMIDDLLVKEGIDPQFSGALFGMMEQTLSKKLPHSDALLLEKGASACMKEMEFYFPLKKADIEAITAIIDGGRPTSTSNINAFMTGFIDLLFEHKGAYYILDYKSDFLGKHSIDYTPEKLREAISKSGYHYQYHIYSVAVFRALKRLLGETFDYNTHFGGCYYVYLRGIQKDEDANGIFFDKPSLDVIQSLDAYFGGVEL